MPILSMVIVRNIIIRVLLTSVTGAFFKHTKFSNYYFKISKFSISNALITQTFIKKLPFKVLNQCPGH